MGYFASRALLLSALAMVAATPWPAGGQCRLCGRPTTAPAQSDAADDVALEIQTSIDFDRLVLFGAGDGTAVIRPDGSHLAQGSVGDIGSRAMVGTARVHGQPGRTVRIDLPRQIDLFSLGGGRIRFDEVASDLPSLPRLDSAGNLSFRFGGRVQITGDSDGAYRGQLPITVEYQ
ncbi:MAG: DUF4402 domain-containing protein [Sphingomicrobium sp.]